MNVWAFEAMMGVILAGGMGISWAMGIRYGRKREQAADSECAVNGERPPAEFRRPAEFGPLWLPWDQIERIRVAIFADQLGAVDSERTEPKERVLFWLQWWEDSGGLFAATGRTL